VRFEAARQVAAFEQILKSIVIPIIKFAGVEVAFLGFHDVRDEIEFEPGRSTLG